jgi:uncharacterized membrane protein YqaE (UPF0057 family)
MSLNNKTTKDDEIIKLNTTDSTLSKHIIICYEDYNISHKLYFTDDLKQIDLAKTKTTNTYPISVYQIISILQKHYNIPSDTFFLVFNGKILLNWQYIYPYHVVEHFNTVDVIPRMKGGGFLDMILSPIEVIFKPMIAPFIIIGQVFEFLIQIIIYIIKFFAWLIKFVIWLFVDFLNPTNFSRDFFQGFIMIIYLIFSTVINLLYSILAVSVNAVGSTFSSTFWGWDQSNITAVDKQSDYFKKNTCKNKKCYLTEKNTIPFSVIFGTILCPPLGVFMEYGITGWLNILICMLLTLCFYLPGLSYALLVIYIG